MRPLAPYPFPGAADRGAASLFPCLLRRTRPRLGCERHQRGQGLAAQTLQASISMHMLGLIRLVLAIAVAFVGWNAGARLQVFEPATLVVADEGATTYKGRVSRELLSGDWVVEVQPQVRMLVSQENFGALGYRGSGLNAYALGAVVAGFVVALFVGFPGLARWIASLCRAGPKGAGGSTAT